MLNELTGIKAIDLSKADQPDLGGGVLYSLRFFAA